MEPDPENLVGEEDFREMLYICILENKLMEK